MRSQSEVMNDIQELIQVELWKRYLHLSFKEMAEVPELFEFRDELIQAEYEWFEGNQQ